MVKVGGMKKVLKQESIVLDEKLFGLRWKLQGDSKGNVKLSCFLRKRISDWVKIKTGNVLDFQNQRSTPQSTKSGVPPTFGSDKVDTSSSTRDIEFKRNPRINTLLVERSGESVRSKETGLQ
ncbi:hypothetical protein Tco_1264180 [Tanacetum coccineum]